MPWIIAELNGQYQLTRIVGPAAQDALPEHLKGLPDDATEYVLIDTPRALNEFLNGRKELQSFLQTLAENEPEQEADDEPHPLPRRVRANVEPPPPRRARRAKHRPPSDLDATDKLRHYLDS